MLRLRSIGCVTASSQDRRPDAGRSHLHVRLFCTLDMEQFNRSPLGQAETGLFRQITTVYSAAIGQGRCAAIPFRLAPLRSSGIANP